ncbi:FitA-like ribbon-helix-helix domain-containing protein [Bosea sp. (in: a-proteobacteria)]|jgi:plasmid stability protein|uniref:FitA-like ribbon-helix-helix domain-containing protein n=1 Tax=Bosea sp. (in: a-proteobacteria) TaxID=1871050 RepID=UPI003F6F4888
MGQVLVRNIDDDVIAGLKVKARLAGVSFETFARDTLRAAAPLTGPEKASLLAEFHQKHGLMSVTTSPEDIIREERDRRDDRR